MDFRRVRITTTVPIENADALREALGRAGAGILEQISVNCDFRDAKQVGLARENMPREKTTPAWKIWQVKEDEYIREFQPQEKADIVIDGLRSFEERLK